MGDFSMILLNYKHYNKNLINRTPAMGNILDLAAEKSTTITALSALAVTSFIIRDAVTKRS